MTVEPLTEPYTTHFDKESGSYISRDVGTGIRSAASTPEESVYALVSAMSLTIQWYQKNTKK